MKLNAVYTSVGYTPKSLSLFIMLLNKNNFSIAFINCDNFELTLKRLNYDYAEYKDTFGLVFKIGLYDLHLKKKKKWSE